MKNLRSELSAEDRTDILKRVMAYRGGKSRSVRFHKLPAKHQIFWTLLQGYSQHVSSITLKVGAI